MIKKNLNLNFDLNFGNGGLSLRSMDLINNALSDFKFREKYLGIDGNKVFKMDTIPEDLFFSLYCYLNNYKYLEDNSDFSIELMEGLIEYLNINNLPFGFHKLDRFNQWSDVINKYIEL
jgi:hypothetical protein